MSQKKKERKKHEGRERERERERRGNRAYDNRSEHRKYKIKKIQNRKKDERTKKIEICKLGK